MPKRYCCDFQTNESCLGHCNKEDRTLVTEKDLCTIATSKVDNMPIRCVGEWAPEKIYMLNQYFSIFATGMHKKWDKKLNYIEICSGPGRCISRQGKCEFKGTSLSIMKSDAFKYINKALFFDLNPTVVEILNKRIENIGIENAKAYIGDYMDFNSICSVLKSEINKDSLNLIFIDPTDCSVPFNFLKAICAILPNVDFILNMALWTDYNRNIKNTIEHPDVYTNARNKYASFVGNKDFYNLVTPNMSEHELRELFRSEYIRQLNQLGYKYIDFQDVNRYYYILFASRNKLGLEFWNKALNYEFDGQGALF